jgi:hypothetical protein
MSEFSPLSVIKRTLTNRCSSTSIYEYTLSSLVLNDGAYAARADLPRN